MTTMFDGVDDAKSYVSSMLGVSLEDFEEVPDLRVAGMEAGLLDDPDTAEELKQNIRDRIATQKGFKVTTKDEKEVRFVISPFREGSCVWFVNQNGICFRI